MGLGQSSAALDGIDTQLDRSREILADLWNDRGRNVNRINEDFKVSEQRLNNQFKDSIRNDMQELLLSLSQAEVEGKLDSEKGIREMNEDLAKTLEKLEANSIKYMDALKFEVDRLDKVRQEEKEFKEKSNTVNKDFSAAKGFYVDGN